MSHAAYRTIMSIMQDYNDGGDGGRISSNA
jgi:hypothetical protein